MIDGEMRTKGDSRIGHQLFTQQYYIIDYHAFDPRPDVFIHPLQASSICVRSILNICIKATGKTVPCADDHDRYLVNHSMPC